MPKIVSFEQDWLAHRLGKSVGETVTEIQASRMAAALAEIPICFARNPRLGLGNWLDAQPRFAEEFVKPPARDRIPAPVNHRGCFHIIYSRDAAAFSGGNPLRAPPSLQLIAKKSHDCRRVVNHSGIPFSSYSRPPCPIHPHGPFRLSAH